MPVYAIPAADVEAAAGKAVAMSADVTEARAGLDWWHASDHGKTVDGWIATGQMTEDDAMYSSPLGMYTRELDKAVAAARSKTQQAYTVITPREVTAALRALFPQCSIASRDAGENLIDVTLPERPARQLFGEGSQDDAEREMLLRKLLRTQVQVAGRRTWRARDCSRMVTVTLKFLLPGQE